MRFTLKKVLLHDHSKFLFKIYIFIAIVTVGAYEKITLLMAKCICRITLSVSV